MRSGRSVTACDAITTGVVRFYRQIDTGLARDSYSMGTVPIG